MFVVALELAHYLMLRNLGKARNVSFTLNAGQTLTDSDNQVAPVGGDGGVFIDEIQFDGVITGQIGFNLELGGHEVAGYAVQSTPTKIGIWTHGAARYQVQSKQATNAVVNIDYLSLPDDTIRLLEKMLADIELGGSSQIASAVIR